RTLSATGKATITNMGAEIGATTSIFPYDERGDEYLRATERARTAELAQHYPGLFIADPEVEDEPTSYFDQVSEIDHSDLEPRINGPYSPDRGREVHQLKGEVAPQGFVNRISAVFLGSCTNSSYEDLSRAAAVARQAQAHGVKVKSPFYVNPGSAQIC